MQLNWFWLRRGKNSCFCTQQQMKKGQTLRRYALENTVPSLLEDETVMQKQNENQDRNTSNSVQSIHSISGFQLSSNHRRCRYSLRVLLLLLLIATMLWMLCTVSILQGTWANALNAAFTGLSTIFAALQWHQQMVPERLGTTREHHCDKAGPYRPSVQGMTNTRKGALVVYTPRTWRGTSMRLVSGLHEIAVPTAHIEAISTVVEDRRTGRCSFVCSFPMVPPGHYTLIAPAKQRSTHITVRSGHRAEIDWC